MNNLISRQAEICPKCKRMMREVIQKIGDMPIGNSWFVCTVCDYMIKEEVNINENTKSNCL